jgi:AbrB family looped-hinge helix DNA binding protein
MAHHAVPKHAFHSPHERPDGDLLSIRPLYDICIDQTSLYTYGIHQKAAPMSTTVTVSPKYQIVIPQEVREAMKIKPGQRVMFMEWRGAFVLVPVLDPDEAFGMFKGHDLHIEREKEEYD